MRFSFRFSNQKYLKRINQTTIKTRIIGRQAKIITNGLLPYSVLPHWNFSWYKESVQHLKTFYRSHPRIKQTFEVKGVTYAWPDSSLWLPIGSDWNESIRVDFARIQRNEGRRWKKCWVEKTVGWLGSCGSVIGTGRLSESVPGGVESIWWVVVMAAYSRGGDCRWAADHWLDGGGLLSSSSSRLGKRNGRVRGRGIDWCVREIIPMKKCDATGWEFMTWLSA